MTSSDPSPPKNIFEGLIAVLAAYDRCASATLCTPRGGSRWRKLLTSDMTHSLVRSSDIPILVLPDREETELSSPETNQTDN